MLQQSSPLPPPIYSAHTPPHRFSGRARHIASPGDWPPPRFWWRCTAFSSGLVFVLSFVPNKELNQPSCLKEDSIVPHDAERAAYYIIILPLQLYQASQSRIVDWPVLRSSMLLLIGTFLVRIRGMLIVPASHTHDREVNHARPIHPM